MAPLAVGRERSRAALEEAVKSNRPIGLLLQNTPETDEPTPEDVHWVGTSATVVRYFTTDGGNHAVLQGNQRFRVLEWLEGYPFMAARVQMIEDTGVGDPQVEGRARALRQRAVEILQLLPQLSPIHI